jgi:hypothetical protein
MGKKLLDIFQPLFQLLAYVSLNISSWLKRRKCGYLMEQSLAHEAYIHLLKRGGAYYL